MTKVRAIYDYGVQDGTVRIIDKHDGNSMSVTNDAEAVMTEIRETEGKYIESHNVIYRDTEGRWDTIIPTWRDGKCVSVSFKPGV